MHLASRSACGLAVALVAVLATGAGASAQEADSIERARAAFEEGRVAYEAGNFEGALERFEEAHRLTGSAEILYNIGTVADRLRRDELALESYRGYLEARPDSPDRAQIEGRIRVLERQLAEREEAARDAAAAGAGGEGDPATPPAEPAGGSPGEAPWVVTGVGAAVALAGGALLIVAALDDACVSAPADCVEDPAAPRWSEVSDRYDRVPIFQAVGGAMLGLGAAAAVVGLVWGLSAGPNAEVALGPTGARLRGRF